MPKAYAAIINPALDFAGSGEGGGILATQFAALWRAAIIVGAILLIMYLLWGAISWITAGGDKAKVEGARNQITHAIVGFAILAGTVALVTFLGSALKIDFLENLEFNLGGGGGGGGGTTTSSGDGTCNGTPVGSCANGGGGLWYRCLAANSTCYEPSTGRTNAKGFPYAYFCEDPSCKP